MTSLLKNRLLKRLEMGNLRSLELIPTNVDFSSNDYLGLARSPQFSSTILHEWEKNLNLGVGSTGSRLLTGNSRYVEDLENKIAKFHDYESALLFSCGYMANLGLMSVISHAESIVFYDVNIHASIYDGIRLYRTNALPFRHNDVEHLENRLKGTYIKNKYICVESIYSTDGSKAPLKKIIQLAQQYNAQVIVDEAHALGVYGPNGRGLVAENNLTDYIFAQVNTFGKALGTYGATILGSSLLKQSLINFATSYVYTTALPYQVLASIKCSYELFPKMDQERNNLRELIQFFSSSCQSFSQTSIQPLFFKGNQLTKDIAEACIQKGFDVRPLLSPTVKRGYERLRICLHAFNTKKEVVDLINCLQTLQGF